MLTVDAQLYSIGVSEKRKISFKKNIKIMRSREGKWFKNGESIIQCFVRFARAQTRGFRICKELCHMYYIYRRFLLRAYSIIYIHVFHQLFKNSS